MSKKNYSDWTKEELVDELNKYSNLKKYGVVWEDKPEEVAVMCKTKLPVLVEDSDKEILNTDNGRYNILIEGDNYHSLSVLNITHKNKVDVIFADPPYNTGSSAWRYNNDFVDGEDRFRHSKWLSFMHKRLSLAKKLLKETGVIVVTIDDYEINTLGLLMDEIFEEKNRIGIVVVENNPRGRTRNAFFATCHEYYLFYAKNIESASITNPELTEEQASAFNLKDDIGQYRLLPFRRSGGLSTPAERPNSHYPIYYNPKTGRIDIVEFTNSKKIIPIDKNGIKRVWRQTRPSLMNAVKRGDIIIKEYDDGFSVMMKDRIKDGRKPKTIWVDSKFDASTHGTILLEKILGKRQTFDYPKSIHALTHTLGILVGNNKSAIVLDFFAGSGTTGHAVLEMNKEDEGERQFIMCTNNENNICSEVCYPRIKNVIKEIGKDSPSNLKYFKTDFCDAIPTDRNKKKLAEKSTELLCLRENCFKLEKKGKDFKIYSGFDDLLMGVVFDESAIETFVEEILKNKKKIVVYVFSLDSSVRDEEFKSARQYVDLKPIPAIILNVYKGLFK